MSITHDKDSLFSPESYPPRRFFHAIAVSEDLAAPYCTEIIEAGTRTTTMYNLDANGPVPNCMNGDLLISAIEPGSFVSMREFAEKFVNGKSSLKKTAIEGLNSAQAKAVFSDELRRRIIEAWESADFEEIDFINSVDVADNPVLRISKLKKFRYEE